MNEKVVKSRDIYNVQLPHFIMPFRMKSFKRCEYLWAKNSTVDTSNSLSESHWNPNNFRLHLSLYTRISKRISGASSDFFSLHYVHCVAVVSPLPFLLFAHVLFYAICKYTGFTNVWVFIQVSLLRLYLLLLLLLRLDLLCFYYYA